MGGVCVHAENEGDAVIDGQKLLGDAIKRRRTKLGFTQRAFAAELDITAVHMCNVERGHAMPSFEMLLAICVKLDVLPSKLFKEIGL